MGNELKIQGGTHRAPERPERSEKRYHHSAGERLESLEEKTKKGHVVMMRLMRNKRIQHLET